MKLRRAQVLAWLLVLSVYCVAQDPKDKLVSFPGPNGTLAGYLYKPAGDGPFPAILWNHGSEKLPGWQPDLAEYFVSHGYVFFLPHRAGQGKSPGAYVMDGVQKAVATGDLHQVVTMQERTNMDVEAAAAWLARQSFVDKGRMAMVGCSFGGIQTLLSSEKGMGFKAFVSFAPAAKSWSNVALQDRLKEAAAHPKAPVFILQAANDFSTEPTKTIGPIVEKHGGKAKLYPTFGNSAQDGIGHLPPRKVELRHGGRRCCNLFRTNFPGRRRSDRALPTGLEWLGGGHYASCFPWNPFRRIGRYWSGTRTVYGARSS